MRDDDKEADQDVQNIQIQETENLRTACVKHYHNSYEYCTLQQELSKKDARQVKKKLIIIMIVKLYMICFLHSIFLYIVFYMF